jgi:aromatic ring hydroxylase
LRASDAGRATGDTDVRTGAEYREGLRDGREVWILGEGRVEDVTVHPATAAMVDEYAAWYDRHDDPAWQERLFTPPDVAGRRRPLAFEIPKTSDDLRRLGRAIHDVAFLNAGNITHTPGYGALIALGVLDAVKTMGVPEERIAAATSYRDALALSGRFLTFCGGTLIPADRFRTPETRDPVRLVRETDAGVVVRGMAGLHTAVPFADEVFISAGLFSSDPKDRVWFSVPVSAPGVRCVARRMAARHANPFMSPLSRRFDELDAQLWLDDVFVPFEHVFALRFEPSAGRDDARRRDSIVSWLVWHQNIALLARAEFTLGLALAVADSMGLRGVPPVVDSLVDLVIDVETIRTGLTAAELDPEVTPAGYLLPRLLHLAPSTIYAYRARQRMAEVLRSLAGQAGVLTPSDADLADPVIGPGLEHAFGGGGYTALQRAALLQLVSDHVASALDGREAAFETQATGGMPGWRNRIQRWFESYDELTNGVTAVLDVEMPSITVDDLRDVGRLRRAGFGVTPPAQTAAPAAKQADQPIADHSI